MSYALPITTESRCLVKTILVLFFCLIAFSASAQEYVFRGEFVKTYSVNRDDLSRAMVIFHFSRGGAKVIFHPQGQSYLPV